jgi:hypothetical protein
MSFKELLSSKIRIIQSSQPRTGSTLLTNILYGLFCYDKNACFSNQIDTQILKTNFILKTHQTDLLGIQKKIINYNLFFVCSERPQINRKLKPAHKTKANSIIFDYTKDLLIQDTKTIIDVVKYVKLKLETKLPEDIMKLANIELASKRIEEMNEYYETIKDKPFSFFDDHYGIHGSHRNRGC